MYVKLSVLFFAFISITSFAQEVSIDSITYNGKKLIQILDSSGVEHLWLKGYHVNWQTGESLKPYTSKINKHTHCSAFVPAIAQRLGIHLLNPTEKIEERMKGSLADYQCDWLKSDEGAKQGWLPVTNAYDAENEANKGNFVVAVYKSDDYSNPGHIAIVRPSVKTRKKIEEEGTQLTQAGGTNAYNISLKKGFRHHPAAWPNGVIFYEHPINWDAIK